MKKCNTSSHKLVWVNGARGTWEGRKAAYRRQGSYTFHISTSSGEYFQITSNRNTKILLAKQAPLVSWECNTSSHKLVWVNGARGTWEGRKAAYRRQGSYTFHISTSSGEYFQITSNRNTKILLAKQAPLVSWESHKAWLSQLTALNGTSDKCHTIFESIVSHVRIDTKCVQEKSGQGLNRTPDLLRLL